MPDDTGGNRNVIAVTYEEEAIAVEAFSRLKELNSRDDIDLHGAAVVAREDDGKLVEKDEYEEDHYDDTVGGGLLGLLVGVLGGPIGIIVGGAAGVLVGSLFDEDEDDETDSALGEISKAIRVGPPGLLVDVSESGPEAIDAVMAHCTEPWCGGRFSMSRQRLRQPTMPSARLRRRPGTNCGKRARRSRRTRSTPSSANSRASSIGRRRRPRRHDCARRMSPNDTGGAATV
jgi:uncharacterized membrane protein